MSPGIPLPRGRDSTASEGSSAHEASVLEAAARLRILVHLSRQLAEAEPDLELALDTVCSHLVSVLGDGCAAYLLREDDTSLEPITIRHRDPVRRGLIEQVNQARQLRVGEGFVGKAVASGRPICLPEADPTLLQSTVVPEYRAYLERVGVSSLIVVPMEGKARVHGAFWLARDPGSPPYTQADRELIEAVADCAATALDSLRLHAELREDRRRLAEAASRMSRLQQVTAALSGAATPEEVATVVAQIAVASMEGAAGSLVLPDATGTVLEIAASVGHAHAQHVLKRFQTLPVTADNPVAAAYREGKAFFFEDLASYGAQYPALLPSASEAGYQAAAALPLLARDEVLGVLWVRFATARAFDENERGLMSTMVAQSAQALERARLYTQAKKAVAQRDEFLSVAAHELRTPLTTMKLQVQSLQKSLGRLQAPEDSKSPLLAKAGGVDRQVKRLEALVTDLLDLSRLTAGKLELRLEEFDLQELVREVRERMAEDATRAESPITVHAQGAARGRWDRARLDQVLSNLLSNALKYGAGRPIEVTVTADGDRALLSVKDRGIGIPLEDQARIFERFERAVPGQNYSGFGVGLWICKQIVAALGGQIRVESQPGEGSTFEVSLATRQEP
ncbi:GAF domain-containing sensor histidine kinase [Hyalangium gracile]|uniref:GAF domain-containing sensor histidine kinase n=1 Tax=Hyalangium gracile TaxID=394092 RepID=UPI001CCB9313|nr:GAF domain-containing protein [Hyalangium gracile]